jgi:hypothetical protein
MRLAPALLALALASAPQLSATAVPACADPPLALNEILPGPARDWDGSGTFSSRDDEWVELLNPGAGALDLTGYFLTDGDSIPRFALSGTLAAGARLVVYGKNAFDWERATGHPAFGLSLSNSGDQVILWRVAGAETTLVERYAYRSHEAAADRAIGRLPEGGGEWALFDGLNPYTGTLLPQGNGCDPTPGAPNLCESTPTRAVSWGRVKTLYR